MSQDTTVTVDEMDEEEIEQERRRIYGGDSSDE